MEKNAIKKYYQDIYKMFPIHGKNEKSYLDNIYNQIKEVSTLKKDCSYEFLVEEIGNPKDIVISYYQDLDTEEFIKEIDKKDIGNTSMALS